MSTLKPLGQADRLPDPHHLLIGGDRAGPAIDVRVAFDDDDLQAHLTQQVSGGDAGRPVADHGHVVGG